MPNYPHTITYRYHPIKTTLLLPLSILVYAPVVYVWVYDTFSPEDKGVLGILLLCALVYSWVIGRLFWRMVAGKPAMVLTHDSIFVYSLHKKILWRDIASIHQGHIKLKDVHSYTSFYKNPLKRWFYRVYSWVFGYTFQFPMVFMDGKAETIDEVLDDYHRQATQHVPNS